MPKGHAAAGIRKPRDRRAIAKLVAANVPHTEIARVTGYSTHTIRHLERRNPAFRAMVLDERAAIVEQHTPLLVEASLARLRAGDPAVVAYFIQELGPALERILERIAPTWDRRRPRRDQLLARAIGLEP